MARFSILTCQSINQKSSRCSTAWFILALTLLYVSSSRKGLNIRDGLCNCGRRICQNRDTKVKSQNCLVDDFVVIRRESCRVRLLWCLFIAFSMSKDKFTDRTVYQVGPKLEIVPVVLSIHVPAGGTGTGRPVAGLASVLTAAG